MAARSIATLTVSFGMVSIPVKLFSATEASRAISFNLLHKACGYSPVMQAGRQDSWNRRLRAAIGI